MAAFSYCTLNIQYCDQVYIHALRGSHTCATNSYKQMILFVSTGPQSSEPCNSSTVYSLEPRVLSSAVTFHNLVPTGTPSRLSTWGEVGWYKSQLYAALSSGAHTHLAHFTEGLGPYSTQIGLAGAARKEHFTTTVHLNVPHPCPTHLLPRALERYVRSCLNNFAQSASR